MFLPESLLKQNVYLEKAIIILQKMYRTILRRRGVKIEGDKFSLKP
jgi:hypothetical protein